MQFIGYKRGHFVNLVPADIAESLSDGEYSVEIKKQRNYGFHKKFFALLNAAFKLWSPDPAEGIGKCFDTFREDVIVAAGYYEPVHSMGGNVRKKAKSISFAKMGQPEFEILYSKTIDAILWNFLPQGVGYDELVEMENNILNFS